MGGVYSGDLSVADLLPLEEWLILAEANKDNVHVHKK